MTYNLVQLLCDPLCQVRFYIMLDILSFVLYCTPWTNLQKTKVVIHINRFKDNENILK